MARPLWQEAASYAARAHRHAVRKDGFTPYVAHPFRVAMTVRDVFGCEDPIAMCAALLHDTIEDAGSDYDEIQERFGPEVADCVAALTKTMALPEAAREAEYDARLARADWRARLVKLADTYDNFSDLSGRDPSVVAKAAEKCRRALRLAQADVAGHESIRRAVEAVERLLGGA
jgi:(p)ppGpp synthase/HD superfamily hydrolase